MSNSFRQFKLPDNCAFCKNCVHNEMYGEPERCTKFEEIKNISYNTVCDEFEELQF